MVHLVLYKPFAHSPDQGDEDLPHHDGHRHRVTLLLNDFSDFSNREGVTQMLLSWGLLSFKPSEWLTLHITHYTYVTPACR